MDDNRRAGYPAVLVTADHAFVAYVLSNLSPVMLDFFGERLASSGDGSDWQVAATVSPTAAPATALTCTPPLVAAADGSLLLGLATNTGLLFRSTDDGVTWASTPVARPFSTLFGVATAGTRAYVLDQLGMDNAVEPFDLTTGTFGAPLELPLGFVLGGCPSIWASANDVVVVGGAGNGPVIHSANQGVSWDPVQNYGAALVSKIVNTDASVFYSSPGLVVRSDDNGRTWALESGGSDPNADKVALAAAGSFLYSAYQTEPDEVVWVTASQDGGVSWSAPVHVVTNAGSWDFSASTQGGTRVVMLVHGPEGIHSHTSTDDGVSWN